MTFHETADRGTLAVTSSDRAFGLVFAGVFTMICLFPFLRGEDIRWWSLAVALVFLMLSLVRPRLLHPLNRIWTAFGLMLHAVVSPLVMGLLFFAVVTPMAVLMRIMRKVPLALNFDRTAKTYWIVRTPPGPSGETMKNQF